jgi:hypothetical protein
MSGMPHSAAATGLVDHVLPVEEMPAKLLDYQRHLLGASNHKDGDGTRIDAAEHLASIIALLRNKIGHDFGKYKEKTITRRMQPFTPPFRTAVSFRWPGRRKDEVAGREGRRRSSAFGAGRIIHRACREGAPEETVRTAAQATALVGMFIEGRPARASAMRPAA